MTTSTQIFNGTTAPGTIDSTALFSGATVLFMVYTGASGLEYSFDCALQVFVSPTDQRAIPLDFDSVVDTVATTFIPAEYMGLTMRLDIFSSAAVPIQVWAIEPDCSCKPQLDSIETKVNLLLADAIASTITKIIGLVVSGGATAILPALLPGAARTAIKILNPSTESVLIGYGSPPSLTDYQDIIPPNSILDESGFGGAVYAMTASGNPASINVSTFP